MLGLITTLSAIIALAYMFQGNLPWVYVAAVISVLDLCFENLIGNTQNPATSILAAVGGAIYACTKGISIFYGICLGLCWESAVIGVTGYIWMILLVLWGTISKTRAKSATVKTKKGPLLNIDNIIFSAIQAQIPQYKEDVYQWMTAKNVLTTFPSSYWEEKWDAIQNSFLNHVAAVAFEQVQKSSPDAAERLKDARSSLHLAGQNGTQWEEPYLAGQVYGLCHYALYGKNASSVHIQEETHIQQFRMEEIQRQVADELAIQWSPMTNDTSNTSASDNFKDASSTANQADNSSSKEVPPATSPKKQILINSDSKWKIVTIVLSICLAVSCFGLWYQHQWWQDKVLLSVPVKTSSYTPQNKSLVIVTPHGSKYHKSGCSYLSKDTTGYKTMTIKEAEKKGYKACSRCFD